MSLSELPATAETCTGCLHPVAAEARYCPQCGLPHIAATSAEADSPDEPGKGVVWPVVAVVALAAGVLGWQVLGGRSPTPVGDPTTGADQAADATTVPADGESEATDMAASAQVVTTPPPDEVDLIEVSVSDLAEDDTFASLAGQYLFASHSQGLVRIDIDGGQVDEFDWPEPHESVVGRYRDQLILLDGQGRVSAVSVSRPGAPSTTLFDLEGQQVFDARMVDDRILALVVWVADDLIPSGSVRLLVDLETKTQLDVVNGWRADDVTWVPGGGVFQFVDGAYRRVAEGHVMAATDREILIYRCDAPDDCQPRWIDRDRGQPSASHPPPEGIWGVEPVDGSDRVIQVYQEDTPRYFDIDQGWYLPANLAGPAPDVGFLQQTSGPATANDRFLFVPQAKSVLIYDLHTQDTYRLGLGHLDFFGSLNLVLAPKPPPRGTGA